VPDPGEPESKTEPMGEVVHFPKSVAAAKIVAR
jgi:hypothetical protein